MASSSTLATMPKTMDSSTTEATMRKTMDSSMQEKIAAFNEEMENTWWTTDLEKYWADPRLNKSLTGLNALSLEPADPEFKPMPKINNASANRNG